MPSDQLGIASTHNFLGIPVYNMVIGSFISYHGISFVYFGL